MLLAFLLLQPYNRECRINRTWTWRNIRALVTKTCLPSCCPARAFKQATHIWARDHNQHGSEFSRATCMQSSCCDCIVSESLGMNYFGSCVLAALALSHSGEWCSMCRRFWYVITPTHGQREIPLKFATNILVLV